MPQPAEIGHQKAYRHRTFESVKPPRELTRLTGLPLKFGIMASIGFTSPGRIENVARISRTGIPITMTHGRSLDNLREHLLDLYKDLSTGKIPSVRQHARTGTGLKRREPIKKIEAQGGVLIRHGGKHELVFKIQQQKFASQCRRHNEINEYLARSILRKLSNS